MLFKIVQKLDLNMRLCISVTVCMSTRLRSIRTWLLVGGIPTEEIGQVMLDLTVYLVIEKMMTTFHEQQ